MSRSASAHLLGGFERATALEDGEAREELLLCGGEQVVAPLDRGSQGPLAGIGVAAALQQIESCGDALEELGRRQDRHARGGQLDREGQAFQAGAELGDLRRRLRLRALAEEGDAFCLGERGKGIGTLAFNAQEFARGHEQRELAARLQELREGGGRLEQVLQVVEQEQKLLALQVGCERSEGALTGLLAHRQGLAERG